MEVGVRKEVRRPRGWGEVFLAAIYSNPVFEWNWKGGFGYNGHRATNFGQLGHFGQGGFEENALV